MDFFVEPILGKELDDPWAAAPRPFAVRAGAVLVNKGFRLFVFFSFAEKKYLMVETLIQNFLDLNFQRRIRSDNA